MASSTSTRCTAARPSVSRDLGERQKVARNACCSHMQALQERVASLELKLDQLAVKVQRPPGLAEGKVRCGCAQSSLRAMEERQGVLEQVLVLVD